MLGVVGVLCKLIGVLYRVPLAAIVGAQGLGQFQLVFPFYTLLLTISSAGLPVALSVQVARMAATGQGAHSRVLLRGALLRLGALGALGTLAMALGSGALATATGDAQAWRGFLALSPAIVLVMLLAACRGYLQGWADMASTAVSQLLEQLARVAISLPMAAVGMRRGSAVAAAMALLGTTLAEVAALAYVGWVCARHARQHAPAPERVPTSAGGAHRAWLRAAWPVTCVAALVPLMNLLDTFTCVGGLLRGGLTAQQTAAYGWHQGADALAETAVTLYGLYSGAVLTLLNVCGAVALALATAVAPWVARTHAQGDAEGLRRHATFILRATWLLGLPCTAGLFLLADPLMALFYPGFTPSQLAEAARILRVSAAGVACFMLAQGTAGVLQGMGLHRRPMQGMALGMACKLALGALLLPRPTVGVLGAAWGSVLGFAVCAVWNTVALLRATRARMPWGSALRTLMAAGGMAGALYAALAVFGAPAHSAHTLAWVCMAAALYAALACMLGAVVSDDLRILPGGAALAQRLLRRHVLRA